MITIKEYHLNDISIMIRATESQSLYNRRNYDKVTYISNTTNKNIFRYHSNLNILSEMIEKNDIHI